ncbi:MAG TPA: DUF3943 domain-containing protein [Polyangiaceae bacterium]|nr:DUF3943 domain-containing protein [Polyangiaceae bacterium]
MAGALALALGACPGTARAEQDDDTSEAHWAPPVLHTTGLFIAMRLTEAAIWPEPFARTEPDFWWARYEDAFTLPPKFDPSLPAFEWDGDPWTINVLGHALLGSELYLRARQCHFGWAGSLAFTAAGSVAWEYVFEANGVRPSAQDLVWTPLSGWALGEARFQAARALNGKRGAAQVLRIVLDPFGEAARALGSGC